MRIKSLGLAGLWALASLASAAQEVDPNDPKSFSVTANIQTQFPLEAGTGTAEMGKAIADLGQKLGDLANRECDLMAAAFKAECHVAQLNIGTNLNEMRSRQMFNGANGGKRKEISATLNVTFALTPKAEAPRAAPSSAPAPSATPAPPAACAPVAPPPAAPTTPCPPAQ